MYVAVISVPVTFDAESDDDARAIVEKLLDRFAQDGITLGELRDAHSAELHDAPSVEDLLEALPYEEPRQVPVGQYQP